jgi:asparagine synthase (glutamine-hydrolysing)
MCGISGIASKGLGPLELQPLIERMARSLRHRGPDGTFVQCFGPPAIPQGVALAHNRLAIIDVSEAGREPMSNEDGTVWLVFNGEIYNFQELRPRLEARGHRFHSRTDAEVILHLYEDAGPDCVNELEGIFAFAILDLKRAELFLARDPIGVKPLFYAATRDHFLFGSEIKAILAASLAEAVMNRQAVSDFFTFLYVPCPETAFDGILQLPPAHLLQLRLKDHSLSIKRYWEVSPDETVEHSSYDDLKAQIRERLAATVKRQLVSDVPLGVFLSGGVDSTIVAGLAREAQADIQTYTLTLPGAEYRFYDETEKARAVSRHLRTQHFELPLERPELSDILNLVEFSDQPFANPTTYLMYALSKKAREHITVALCGAGGDELFAGYPRTAAVRLAKRLGWVPRPFLRFGKSLLGLARDSHRNPRLRRARKFLDGLDSDFFVQYSNWTYFLKEKEKHRLLRGDFGAPAGRNGLRPSVDVLRTAFDQCFLSDPDNCVLEMDLKTFLADNVLEYTDRMSMAAPLEVRVPLLDAGFAELALNAPFAYKIRGGHAKAILMDAFAGFFPPEVREAPKRGFNAPLGRWAGRLFDDYFEAGGRASRTLREKLGEDAGAAWREGVLDFDFIQQLRAEHRRGTSDRSHELFACMIFDVWWRKYIRKTQPLVHW